MINDDTPKLLRSLAKLIEKPEIKALQCSLIQTLQQLIAAESIELFDIRSLKQIGAENAEDFLIPVGYDDAIDDDDLPPILLKDDPLFVQCLETKNMAVSTRVNPGDSLRFIHPVQNMKTVTGFLVIKAREHIERDQELANILLGFFRNYVSLLNDNQRDHLTGLLNRKCFEYCT